MQSIHGASLIFLTVHVEYTWSQPEKKSLSLPQWSFHVERVWEWGEIYFLFLLQRTEHNFSCGDCSKCTYPRYIMQRVQWLTQIYQVKKCLSEVLQPFSHQGFLHNVSGPWEHYCHSRTLQEHTLGFELMQQQPDVFNPYH